MPKCATKFCRGHTTPNGHSPYCSACRSRRWRESNPVLAAYHNLKISARRRHIEFTITPEYFREWCNTKNYIAQRGRTKSAAQVDRIDEDKGYVPGNLQVLKGSLNIGKYYEHLWKTREEKQAAIREAEEAVRHAYPQHELDTPF